MKLEQELVILGLLWTTPRHGYEIKKQINEFLTYFSGLEYESIYYSLKSLEKKDLVRKQIAQTKKRPEKYIYSLTQKGKVRFMWLLDRSFLTIQRPYFSLDVSLYFLPHVPLRSARLRLKARLRIVKNIEKSLLKIKPVFVARKPAHLQAILEHNLALLRAEISFLSELMERLPELKKVT